MLIAPMRRIHFARHARGSHRIKIWAGPTRGWISREMYHLRVREFPILNCLPILSCKDLPFTGGYTYQRGIGSAAIVPYPAIR